MKKWSRPILIGVLMLVLWTSACNLPVQTPPSSGTIIPKKKSATPTATNLISITGTTITATGTPLAVVIPITGENVVQMQCQFCVNSLAHAVFIFPDAAIFDVESASPVSCLTAEVVNGKRVLVCNGTQSTSFNLKICSDPSNCLLFPVALEPCPLAGVGTPVITATAITPVFLTAINTLRAPFRTPTPKEPVGTPVPTQTGVLPTLAATTTPQPPESTSTSAPPPPPADTSTSAPPPPPPTQPADTPAPTSETPGGHKKPTHTPRP